MEASETSIQLTFAHVAALVACQVRHSPVTIDVAVCSPLGACVTLTGSPA